MQNLSNTSPDSHLLHTCYRHLLPHNNQGHSATTLAFLNCTDQGSLASTFASLCLPPIYSPHLCPHQTYKSRIPQMHVLLFLPSVILLSPPLNSYLHFLPSQHRPQHCSSIMTLPCLTHSTPPILLPSPPLQPTAVDCCSCQT